MRWWLSLISIMNSIGTAWVFVLLVIINPDIGGVNLDLDIIIDHWINPNRAKRSVALGGTVKR